MDKSVEHLLERWVENLDYQIGDTKAAIEKRKKEHEQEVLFRSDLTELLEFIKKHEIPEGARRALISCLEWNPHATK